MVRPLSSPAGAAISRSVPMAPSAWPPPLSLGRSLLALAVRRALLLASSSACWPHVPRRKINTSDSDCRLTFPVISCNFCMYFLISPSSSLTYSRVRRRYDLQHGKVAGKCRPEGRPEGIDQGTHDRHARARPHPQLHMRKGVNRNPSRRPELADGDSNLHAVIMTQNWALLTPPLSAAGLRDTRRSDATKLAGCLCTRYALGQ
eukprot:COSAG06_NODE_2324_length_7083_cov_6.158648_9_plen_204_part_00